MSTHNNPTNRPIRSFLIFASALLLFSGSILAQKVWTLEECIQHALANNIRIKQSKLDVKTGEINMLESKLDMLPSVNAAASHSYGWGRSIDLATYQYVDQQTQQSYFNLSSDVTLFNGFQKLNSMKKSRADYLAAKYNSDKISNDIAIAVAGYYLQILFSQELVANADRQLEVTQQQVDRTRKLVDAGTLAKGSLLEIQAQLANEEVSVVQAKNQLNLAYLDLLQLLELSSDNEISIQVPDLRLPDAPSLLPIQSIYNTALGIMPEIKSAEYYSISSTKALAIARGSRSPNLGLQGAFGTNYSDQIITQQGEVKSFDDQLKDNRNTTLSIRLNIPIFNGYQISSYINRSKLNLMNANYNLDLARNTLRKNIESAYSDAVAAYASFTARQKSLSSLREAFKYTEEKFNVGMVNAIDYNVAKNQLSRAESDLLSGKYDYIFKLKILDFYLGRTITLQDISNTQE
jgi:outer membrane protein